MNRPATTVVIGNPACKPPPLTMLTDAERRRMFEVSAQCVNRPPAVPSKTNPESVAGFASVPRLSSTPTETRTT